MSHPTDVSRQLIEAIGVGVATYGADGRYEYVNGAYADLLETERETLEGMAIWAVNPTFRRDRFEDYWDSIDVGETRVAETTHAVGGTSVAVTVVTTCDVIDGTRYHFGTILDRRQQREQAAAIEYQRSLLKAQQEATIDGILIVDENDEIVSYNERFAEIWSVPLDLIEERDDEPVLDRVAQQMKNPEEFRERVEYLYAHPEEDSRDLLELRDGRTLDRYTTALTEGDTYYGRLWVFRDITDRIDRQQRLERQNEHLDQFASIVSHDLRNPLNVAELRLQLLDEECDSEHLPAIEGALDRMEALIDDMLTLARKGQNVSDLAPVSLETVATAAWDAVENRGASLAVEDDVSLVADDDRLAQALENLYRNAIEHGGPGVTVTVGTTPHGFYVQDDGPGIDADLRDEVFELGFTTTKRGTGFGLGIVREIVEAHGWRIDVTESNDGGARFEITGVDDEGETDDAQ